MTIADMWCIEEMIVETTYEAIFNKIAKLPLEKADIRLEERVTGVVTASREAPDGQVQIKTEKGETLYFDEVLMTTPLGWLKRNKNVFQPALPDRILAGIDAVSVGHLEKVSYPYSRHRNKAKKSERSTSHSQKPSGLIHHLQSHPARTSHRSSKYSQKTPLQATLTGSLPNTHSQPTPNVGPKKSGISRHSPRPTDDPQYSSTYTAIAPPTSPHSYMEKAQKSTINSLTNSSAPIILSSRISLPRIQSVKQRLFCLLNGRKMNYRVLEVIVIFRLVWRMRMEMLKL